MDIHRILEYKIGNIPVLFFALLFSLLGLSLLTPILGLQLWVGVLAGLIVLGIIFTTFTEYRYSLILLLFYAYFLFLFARILNIPIPLGLPFDLLLGIICISAVVKYSKGNALTNKNPFTTPIGIALLIYLAFDIFELFNPYSYDLSWGVSPFKVTVAYVIGFYVFYKAFDNVRFIKLFMFAWLALSLIAALYGLKQEYIGLTEWEWQWLTNDPKRYSLTFQWGRLRKWSIFSDASAFGLVMSYSAISCFVLMLGPFKTIYRVIALISGILMTVAMSYSGTRTATAMVPLGLGIYFLMNMNNRLTVGVAIISAFIFMAIMFGPFYSPTIIRIRSTFDTDDPSLAFRGFKRERLQDYVLNHPIGGGLGTANETAGRLSTTYDPDNGYLRTALDKGVLGLLIQLGLFFTVMLKAINGYYASEDKKIKSIYASFIASFFAITVAQFFQDSVDQKPVNFIISAGFAMVVRLKEFDYKDINN